LGDGRCTERNGAGDQQGEGRTSQVGLAIPRTPGPFKYTNEDSAMIAA
jgi:hypothetical protein